VDDVESEYFACACRGLDQAHQHFDRGRLTGAVRP
jgi:hypothetical protein